MLFLIIFIISISAILVLFLISSNDNKNLLHYIKESCNIDSVRFEKRTAFCRLTIKRVLKKSFFYIQKGLHHSTQYREKLLDKTKRTVRKKLFNSTQKKQVSDYISEMKK